MEKPYIDVTEGGKTVFERIRWANLAKALALVAALLLLILGPKIVSYLSQPKLPQSAGTDVVPLESDAGKAGGGIVESLDAVRAGRGSARARPLKRRKRAKVKETPAGKKKRTKAVLQPATQAPGQYDAPAAATAPPPASEPPSAARAEFMPAGSG